MKLSDLTFDYPESLIAIEPSRPTRVMLCLGNKDHTPSEITVDQLIDQVPAGDVWVINNTKVLKRRVFTEEGIEILFLDQISNKQNSNTWQVLFPSKKIDIGTEIKLPMGFTMKLLQKGRPQLVEVFPAVSDKDFMQFAELPLPPYIQKARDARHNQNEDESWYQTAWAKVAGSMAAPTASLHFTEEHLNKLKSKNVTIIELTLHVGLGTFLPVTVENLDDHQMHSEWYSINPQDWQLILNKKINGHGVWSVGTTTTRVLESVARTAVLQGQTDIMLKPGVEFKIVDRLLTNFHQPQSTLLALVAGFAGLENVKNNYQWAIKNNFKLFSYGDLSVWIK